MTEQSSRVHIVPEIKIFYDFNMMNMEAQEGSEEMEQSDDVKESKLLCSDAITNFKTV